MCISCLHKSFPTSHGICFPGAVVKGFVLRPVVTVLTVVAVARKMVVSVFPGAFENDFCRRGSPRSVPSVEMRCLDLFWTVKAIWAETEQIEKTRQKKTVYNIHTYVYMYIIYIYDYITNNKNGRYSKVKPPQQAGEGSSPRKTSRWKHFHHFQRRSLHLRHRSETQRSDSRRVEYLEVPLMTKYEAPRNIQTS